MVGVLHTWTRDLRDHPHVHDIVTGGGRLAMGGGGPICARISCTSKKMRAYCMRSRFSPAAYRRNVPCSCP